VGLEQRGIMPSSLLQDGRWGLTALEQVARSATGPVSRRLVTGWKPLDELLPGGGFRAGSLIEWLSPGLGSGGMLLAVVACLKWGNQGRRVVVIDPEKEFYPPALAMHHSLLIVRPGNPRELLWTWEQVLRCRGVGACVGRIDRAPEKAFRRLSLAAERAEVMGMILRAESARQEPSWAEARLLVEARSSPESSSSSRKLRLSLLRARGAISGSSVEVCWDEDAHSLSLAPRLGHPTASGLPYRAS
jgi:protein ImuA